MVLASPADDHVGYNESVAYSESNVRPRQEFKPDNYSEVVACTLVFGNHFSELAVSLVAIYTLSVRIGT